jgi:hypothetical protein
MHPGFLHGGDGRQGFSVFGVWFLCVLIAGRGEKGGPESDLGAVTKPGALFEVDAPPRAAAVAAAEVAAIEAQLAADLDAFIAADACEVADLFGGWAAVVVRAELGRYCVVC